MFGIPRHSSVGRYSEAEGLMGSSERDRRHGVVTDHARVSLAHVTREDRQHGVGTTPSLPSCAGVDSSSPCIGVDSPLLPTPGSAPFPLSRCSTSSLPLLPRPFTSIAPRIHAPVRPSDADLAFIFLACAFPACHRVGWDYTCAFPVSATKCRLAYDEASIVGLSPGLSTVVRCRQVRRGTDV